MFSTVRAAAHVVLAALLSTALVAGEDKLVGGPYVVNPTPRSATIGWVVQTREVKVRSQSDKSERTVPVLRSEKVSMTGLKAGDRISYDVLAGKKEGRGTFLAPAAEGADFHFVI